MLNGISVTGYAEVDELNRLFEVSSIWPLFPGAEKRGEQAMAGYYSITFKDGLDLETILSSYDDLSVIDHVEPVGVHKLDFVPNDQYRGYQWGLGRVNAYNGWNLNQGDPSIPVGIADTGVDWDHPDLNNDIWTNTAEMNGSSGVDDDGNGYIDDYRGWDWVTGVNGYPGEDDQTPDNNPMDFDGHGTHCSGIASAETNNTTGIAGVGFDCSIMALRIGWKATDGWGYVRMDFAASAFYYAANKGAKAINCSWGSSNNSGIGSAANYARNAGVVIVTAAGNDNNTSAPYLATLTHVIAVAATDQTDHKASFSNYGSWVDVSAPGVNIYSTYFNNTYAYLDGTSMAAPFVTGLAGLLFSADPTLTQAAARALIVNYTDNIDGLNPGYSGLLGTGRIDIYNSLINVIALPDAPVPISPIAGEFIDTAYPTFRWNLVESATVYHIQIDNNPSFSSPEVENSAITDTSFTSPDSLGDPIYGFWYWRIRAGNGSIWSDYTSTQYFAIDNAPPVPPVLLTPINNQWVADRTPLFEWDPADDGNGSGVEKYYIQIDNDAGFAAPYLINDSTSVTVYVPGSNLQSNQRYYWRVSAVDVIGNISAYSTGAFGIDTDPPPAPAAFDITPAGWTANPNFTLAWTNPPDSTGIGMALYKIGAQPYNNYDSTGHFDASPAPYTAQDVGIIPVYLWLVDNLGNVTFQNYAVDSMLFDNIPPSGCQASSPDSSANLSFPVSWSEGSDDGSGTSGLYDIRYKDGAGVWTDWIIDTPLLTAMFAGADGHTYYFEARTSDLAGNDEPFTGISETQTAVDTSFVGPPFVPGDANASGDVNGLDVIYLVNYLKGGPPPPDPFLRGDANGSCTVNGLDVTYLVSYLKGGPPPFAGDCR